jgi:amidohydrolase
MAARILSQHRDDLAGSILFCFQPAEEGLGGAQAMVESGLLKEFAPDRAFGIHLWNPLPYGTVSCGPGTIMAAADRFCIDVQGRGGHGAKPHEGTDAIFVASHLVLALQGLVSRETNPFDSTVISVGKFHSGEAFNALADRARLEGTVRTLSTEAAERIPARITEVATRIANTFQASATVEYEPVVLPTVNVPEIASLVRTVASRIPNVQQVRNDERTMGGEDFSFFLRQVPGCFAFVGAGNPDTGEWTPHHSPNFQIDERALGIGASLMVDVARSTLSLKEKS